jgi:predicted ATPase
MRPGDLPDSIRSIVVARLDRLQEQNRRAAQAASVLGTRFSEAELEHLLEGERFEPQGLIGGHLVRAADDGFEFIHALVRDAVYGTLPKSRRMALHLAAAAWYTDRDEGLEAHHLEQAQDSRAAGKYREAAAAALSQFRNSQALAYNTRGLEIAIGRGS